MKISPICLRAGFGFAAVSLAASLFFVPKAQSAPSRKKILRHILVVSVTKGFHHGSIPLAEKTIAMLGNQTGEWDTDFVRTDEDIKAKMTPDALNKYDAVVFANTTGVLPLPDPQGFLDYIKAGHGFAAMHSGSDTFHQWPGGAPEQVSAYIDMLGGEFQEHHGRAAIEAHIDDPDNPATLPLVVAGKNSTNTPPSMSDMQHGHSAVLDKTWYTFDEIYIMKNNDASKIHVLISLSKWPNDGSPHANEPGEHYIAWTKAYGKGKVFYTELGHTPDDPVHGEGMWTDPLYQKHITGGLEFVLGLKKGSTKPSAPTTTAHQ